MNYIFSAILIFTNFTLATTAGLAGKPHQQVILENTLPKEYLNHPLVMAVAKRYRTSLFKIATVFSILSLSFLFITYDSIVLLLFWLIIIGQIVSSFLCEIHFIREMKQLIVENGWEPAIEPKRVDTTLVLNKNKKMVPIYWLYLSYLPTFPLSWYTFKATDLKTATILFASSTLLFVLMLINYSYVARIPAKNLTNNPEINLAYNDLPKRHWSLLTIVINWAMLPLLFMPIFMMESTGILSYLLIALYSGLVIFFVIFTALYLYRLRKKQDALLMSTSEFRYTGEDEYWTYSVYINPDDPKLFIPDRVGMNMGINLGKPLGKAIAAGTALFLVIVFIATTVPTFIYDFTKEPFKLDMTTEAVSLSAPFIAGATIPVEDIEDVELVNAIPKPFTKTFGMATSNQAIGHFRTKSRSAYLLVKYNEGPILKIKTKDVDYYYTNQSPDKTKKLYQELQTIK